MRKFIFWMYTYIYTLLKRLFGKFKKVAKNPASEEFIRNTIDILMTQINQERGAGAYMVSNDDLKSLTKFIKGNGIEVVRYDISDANLAYAYQLIKEKSSTLPDTSFGTIRGLLQNKGAADPDSVKVGTKENPGPGWGRRDKILKSYLECGGISHVTGRPISIGNSNVDHRVSLANGGVDTIENWIWMETNINMFKGALTDKELIKKIDSTIANSPEVLAEIIAKNEITKLTKEVYSNAWANLFFNGGHTRLTVDMLKSMQTPLLKVIIKGWNRVYPKTSELYVYTYKTQNGGSRNGGRGVSLSKQELQENFTEQLVKAHQQLSDIQK